MSSILLTRLQKEQTRSNILLFIITPLENLETPLKSCRERTFFKAIWCQLCIDQSNDWHTIDRNLTNEACLISFIAQAKTVFVMCSFVFYLAFCFSPLRQYAAHRSHCVLKCFSVKCEFVCWFTVCGHRVQQWLAESCHLNTAQTVTAGHMGHQRREFSWTLPLFFQLGFFCLILFRLLILTAGFHGDFFLCVCVSHISVVACQSHRLLALDSFLHGFTVAVPVTVSKKCKTTACICHPFLGLYLEDFAGLHINGNTLELHYIYTITLITWVELQGLLRRSKFKHLCNPYYEVKRSIFLQPQ